MSTILRRVLASLALATLPACFDGEELTEGLRCQQRSHCGGDLDCVNGYCVDPNDMGCDTDPSLCTQASASVSDSLTTSAAPSSDGGTGADGSASMTAAMTTADPFACGQQGESCVQSGCCDFGLCVSHPDGTATCQEQCYVGTDCSSCCCMPAISGGNGCAETFHCGQEAQCLGGCSSPGSACTGDYDCCGGGRCLFNSGGWYSCFKPCASAFDCVSGCCNYNPTIGANICEAC